MSKGQFRFSIDRGGTFTDVYAEVPNEQGFMVKKLLSEDPDNYDDAAREGIRRIMEEVTQEKIPTTKDIDTSKIEWIRMGTTVATNALLERKGAPCALIINRGFKDLLKIGNQSRPRIFDLKIEKPENLFHEVIEVDERVRLVSKSEAQKSNNSFVRGVSGEYLQVLKKPDLDDIRNQLKTVKSKGINSIAVLLLHSYTYPQHEEEIGKIANEMGFDNVSLSSQVIQMVRAVPRGQTTCVDAYLTPKIRQYINSFRSGFQDNLSNVNVTFMQSDGGLADADRFLGSRAILSGPAGGVVGYSMTTYSSEMKQAVIGFDMGGTSTDVSRYSGSFEHVYETELAGVTIQAPQLDIQTVAAGGGSRLFFRSGMFIVGPESAGSHPGPVCYRKGGYLAVTDANLFLGRILPEHFPHIFGPNEDQPLDVEGARNAFQELTKEINQFIRDHHHQEEKNNNNNNNSDNNNNDDVESKLMTAEDVAFGFLRVANESMCRPIREMTVAKGYDTRDHILSCFGGAGPQHACAIARSLGMREVYVHRFSGILSAYGIGLADRVEEVQEPASFTYSEEEMSSIESHITDLSSRAVEALKKQGFEKQYIDTKPFLNLRYEGTDFSIMTPRPENGDFASAFVSRYKKEYGFTLPGRSILVDDVRVRGIGRTTSLSSPHISRRADNESPTPIEHRRVYFENGWEKNTPVYDLASLCAGDTFAGPLIIIHDTSTVVITPFSTASITETGDIHIRLHYEDKTASEDKISTRVDNVMLSIFQHRFMSIAEQMGRTLQRTSISTNIKERLDFSCALFGPQGGLVANAPHIPVHLGSMGEGVKWQIDHLGNDWKEGDVVISNHPKTGGSHLPDITVMTPVFKDGKPVFYVASRGHHADIGGISPGSMPPFSKVLREEGAAIKSFKIVEGGEFQTEGITQILTQAGTRNLRDNLSDLQAQVAANQKGISLVGELIDQYGLDVVQAYMQHVQDNAELAVKELLHELADQQEPYSKLTDTPNQNKNTNHVVVNAQDRMDDGSEIKLRLTIDRATSKAHFDFYGTSRMVLGNTNLPVAVTKSAILYCLRCLVKREIPLNEGCMKPITVSIPDGSLLSPSDEAAVVGGNVLTSQRVTDVVLQSFGSCAASQGCMNNLTFGDETMGYYETIAGGAGAGPHWHGQNGVHTHMTNTRITDVEVFEKRYPVLVKEFSLRTGSGGEGMFQGGSGVVRDIEFLRELHVGILSERRVFQPYGMAGGESGASGRNYLIRNDGNVYNLGGRNFCQVNVGDRIRIETPGGGGYGKKG